MQTMLREDDETLTLSNESLADLKLAINSIQKRSEGLIHFVENYRNLTHVAKPNFQIISVEQLFSRITSLMGNELAVKNIVFIRTIAPESLEITADPELIEQVLINLLRNSIQALEGRIEPQIKLTAKLDERGKILVQVCDNGPGINEDALERIFIPFFSTKRDGSGIGLSLSRQIMRSHGGTIRASSIPDKETIFSLRF
jgi:signal transduction histidine kinase